MNSWNFKGRERQKTTEQLVAIYESQIINSGDQEYINALAELLKEKYDNEGISDFDVEPEDNMDDRNIGQMYVLFEQKVVDIIETYERGEKWKPMKGSVTNFKN